MRVDLSYYVKKCYNLSVNELDYKDKFIGLIGLEDKSFAESIIKGDASMEEILKKVEDFSDDEEILGAYDGEWHRQEVARVVMLDKIEKAEKEGLTRGMKKGIKEGIKEGVEKTALNMLKEKIDINTISKVTGLNIEQIKKLESK